MDPIPLVEMEIEAGRRLLHRLGEEGLDVTAAAWVRESEDSQWFLYLATPLVDEEGATKNAYRRVNEVIRQTQPPLWIDPLNIKVINPKDPIAEAIQSLFLHPAEMSLIRYGVGRLGRLSVGGIHLYPPPPARVR